MENKIRISIRLSIDNYNFIDKLATCSFNGNMSKTIDKLIYSLRTKEGEEK